MNYIIFDLELNNPFKVGAEAGQSSITKCCPNEIIEIGAVKVNSHFEIVDRFEALVRPTFYKTLSPIVQKKTGISYKEVYSGKRFKQVFKNFREWIGEEYTLYAWGYSDLVDLRRNCRCHNIKTCWLNHFKDLQKEFSLKYELEKGMNYSLKRALEFLDISPDADFHRAMADAEYTSKIFIQMYSESSLVM